MSASAVSRRIFLKASAIAGGGLLLTCAFQPDELGVEAKGATQASGQADRQDTSLNAWLRIGTDDRVTLICSQSEMGQGVMTTLPAILAEELGADWNRVRVETSPAAPAYRNPRINFQFTGNSESTTAFFELLRHMGASAREMLIAAAAEGWGVDPTECYAENGKVHHKPSRRSLTFGELVDDAAKKRPPEKPRLKSESEWKLLGKPLPRVELPSKVDGTAIYGFDFKVTGMLHAAVKQSPVFGGKLAAFDKTSVANLSGVVDVVPIPNGIAVVAKSYWQAKRALDKLDVTFDDGANALMSSATLAAEYRAALDGDKWKTVRADGSFKDNPDLLPGADAEVFTAEYESQFLAHATMEPMNCTAHLTDEGCQVWGPLQGPELAQIVLSQVTGLPKEKIFINRTLLGGGFGRRLMADFVVQAALISKVVGAPVKVVWTREEDMRHDAYRPATLNRISAKLDKAGRPEIIHHKLVSPSILQYVFPPAVTEDNDPSCLEGLVERPAPSSPPSDEQQPLYRIPSTKVDFHLLKIGVPTSVLRTTGYGPNVFALESFIDELAHKARRDPYQFRRDLIGNKRLLGCSTARRKNRAGTNPRHAACFAASPAPKPSRRTSPMWSNSPSRTTRSRFIASSA